MSASSCGFKSHPPHHEKSAFCQLTKGAFFNDMFAVAERDVLFAREKRNTSLCGKATKHHCATGITSLAPPAQTSLYTPLRIWYYPNNRQQGDTYVRIKTAGFIHGFLRSDYQPYKTPQSKSRNRDLQSDRTIRHLYASGTASLGAQRRHHEKNQSLNWRSICIITNQ